jgi:hypothetical protein
MGPDFVGSIDTGLDAGKLWNFVKTVMSTQVP